MSRNTVRTPSTSTSASGEKEFVAIPLVDLSDLKDLKDRNIQSRKPHDDETTISREHLSDIQTAYYALCGFKHVCFNSNNEEFDQIGWIIKTIVDKMKPAIESI